jgi:aspartate/methionine/tyrosine aminotransferase
VPYELDESRGWGLDVAHLAEQLAKARAEGTNVRGVVVINPGNPTGQCLSRANMEAVATFCRCAGAAGGRCCGAAQGGGTGAAQASCLA